MQARKILIADDDTQLLQALNLRFKALGCEVHWARDGYQAIEYTRTVQPDVLVLDINMPAGDGFSVLERLSGMSGIAAVPVVFVTGETSPRMDALTAKFGEKAVVRKPFEFDDLLAAIESVVGSPADTPLG